MERNRILKMYWLLKRWLQEGRQTKYIYVSRRRFRISKVTKTGKEVCRAEFFIHSRKKENGNFVNEKAKERAEQLTREMSENPSDGSANNGVAALDDAYSKVFGAERPGRIRCLGRGPTPSKFLRRSATTMPFPGPANSEVVGQLNSQVTTLQSQLQIVTGVLQQLLGATNVQPTAPMPNIGALLSNLTSLSNFPTMLSAMGNLPNSQPTALMPNIGALLSSLTTPPNFTTMLSTIGNQPSNQALFDGQNGAEHEGPSGT